MAMIVCGIIFQLSLLTRAGVQDLGSTLSVNSLVYPLPFSLLKTFPQFPSYPLTSWCHAVFKQLIYKF